MGFEGVAAGLLLAATPHQPLIERLEAVDLRAASIFHRLAGANSARCQLRGSDPAMVLADPLLLAPALRAAFAERYGQAAGPVVTAVVAGGAAARAGLRRGDRLATIDDSPLPAAITTPQALARLVELRRRLAGLERPVRIGLWRGGRPASALLAPAALCAGRIQVTADERPSAKATEAMISVSSGLVERLDDDELAFAIAHELAHIQLRHPVTRRAGGPERELEADETGIGLMAGAGYPPGAALRLIDRLRRWTGPLFFATRHPGWGERRRRAELAIRALAAASSRPPAAP